MKAKLLTIIVMFFLAMATALAAPVSGTVTDAGTSTGIANALVEVFDTTGTLLNSTNADANGTYSVDSVGTGLRIINASSVGYNTQSQPRFVGGGGVTANFILGPIASYTLSGTESGNLANVDINLKQGGVTVFATQTIAGGAYTLNVLNGTYTFEASLVGYDTYTNNSVVIAGNTVHNFALSGSVTTGTAAGYVLNTTGSPLSGADVRLYLGAGMVAQDTTDPTGYYSMTYNQGDYNLTASFTGYNSQTQAVTLNGGQTTDTNFTLPAQGATCTQSIASYGSWSTCSGGTQSRSITYNDYNNVCGNTVTVPNAQSQSCSTGGSSGGSNRDPVVSLTPQIKYPDFFEYNPIQYTLNRMDTAIFYHDDVKYTVMITDIQEHTATFKLFPTYDEFQAEEGEILEFELNEEDSLMLTLLDSTVNSELFEASTVNVNLLLDVPEDDEEEEDKPVVQKIKDAVVKVVGEVVPENLAPSVAVGVSVSASTVVLGLLIFFIIRRVTG
ncbi:carboxypeptidase-like regulatory domain-containing protein [Nanoarchaeota archaeon]